MKTQKICHIFSLFCRKLYQEAKHVNKMRSGCGTFTEMMEIMVHSEDDEIKEVTQDMQEVIEYCSDQTGLGRHSIRSHLQEVIAYDSDQTVQTGLTKVLTLYIIYYV